MAAQSNAPISTSFVGDPRRWTQRPPTFTGGLSWVNLDASNVKSKAHIAKVRAHVRNEYRGWKPGDPPKSSLVSSETSLSISSNQPTDSGAFGSPSRISNSGFSISSTEAVYDEDSSVASAESLRTGPERHDNPVGQLSSASRAPRSVSGTFFDPVRETESPLEKISDLRKKYERPNPHRETRPIPSQTADAAKLISDARAKRNLVQSAVPTRRSKHESGKLLREIRNYNNNNSNSNNSNNSNNSATQKALQSHSLQSSIGALRDDPFLSFPIESRRSVIEAADYWVNSWAPSQTPGYIKAGFWKPTIDKIFSITTTDDGAFESQVALSQCYLSRNYGKGDEPTKEALYHQTRAMLSLRKHLEAGSVSVGPLLSSLNLLIMSIVHGDRKSYNFHRRGLERMIQTPPSDSSTGMIQAVVQGYLVTSRFYFRLLKLQTQHAQQMLLNSPTQTDLRYPRHPFRPDLSAEIATLPSGFRELILELSLPVQLIEVLKIMAHWNTIIAPKPEDEKSSQGVAIWFSWDDSEQALEILEQLSTLTGSRQAIASPLCMILILYSIAAHNRFQSTNIYVQLVQDAVSAIRQLDPTSQSQRECRLWMAVVVSGCARDTGSGNSRIETKGLLRDLASSLSDDFIPTSSERYKSAATRMKEQQHQRQNTPDNPMDWEAVKPIMKKFFWYESFAPTWTKCWELEINATDPRLASQRIHERSD